MRGVYHLNLLPIIIFLLMITAFVCFLFSTERTVIYTKQRLHKLNRLGMQQRQKLMNSEVEKLMRELDLPFSLYHYEVARITFFVIIGIYSLASIGLAGIDTSKLLLVVALLALYFFTDPQTRVLGSKPPIIRLLNNIQSSKRKQYNTELYLLVSQLRNTFKIYGTNAPSSTEIFEEVIRYTNKTKPIFQKFLSYWISGDQDQAVKYFERAIGTNEATKLAQLFEKLDSLPPEELDSQFKTFQDIFRAQRETERTKSDEAKSNIVFTLVVTTCFAIMIDFIIVGFVVDVIDMANNAFNM